VIAAAFNNTGEKEVRSQEFFHGMLFTLACIGLVGIFDLSVGRLFKGRWFAVHAMVNAIIVGMTAVQAVDVFRLPNPYDSCTCKGSPGSCAAHAPLCLSLGLHIWHGLSYPLKPIDWVHHIPNWGFTTAVIYYSWGPMQGFSLFWALMGVPGMLDYALLVGVKQGWIHARVEKDWNQTINVWLRCPFCCICTFLLLGSIWNKPEIFEDKGQMVIQALNAVHCGWNGCFFMYRTVDARTRFEMKMKIAKAEATKAKEEGETVPATDGSVNDMGAPLLSGAQKKQVSDVSGTPHLR
jgi:hypothetical protein